MSRVRFIRAPRGDAVLPPPAVGPQSVLGSSMRAAREDHTHEGVHRVVAGDGLTLTPASGLGDVTLAVRHWRPPVQVATELPTGGNQPGDARLVLSEAAIYVWSGTAWQRVAAGGGGGGGTPAVIEQVTKMGVVADADHPRIVEALVPANVDFAHPPVEVLRFNPGQAEETVVLAHFDNADKADFEPDHYVGFENGMALKTTVELAFEHREPLATGDIWVADIAKRQYREIQAIYAGSLPLVKRVVFRNLSSNLSWLALGGIRFYNPADQMIDSGRPLVFGRTYGETEHFITTASSGYSANDFYLLPRAFDVARDQTGGGGDDRPYWLADTRTNQWLACEFKAPRVLSRIEFNPRPDFTNDRGVTSPFAIDFYGPNDDLVATIPVTPITQNNTVQSVDVPAAGQVLALIQDGDDLKRWNTDLGEWEAVGTQPPTEQDFDSFGIGDLRTLPAAAWNDPGLQNPRLWVRTFTADEPVGYILGIPTPRVVFPTGDLPIGSADRVHQFALETRESGAGVVRVIASANRGQTWHAWDPTNETWVSVDPEDLAEVKAAGMSAATMGDLGPDEWAAFLGASVVIRFAYYLEIDAVTDEAATTRLTGLFQMRGTWEKAFHGTQYTYGYPRNHILQVRLVESGDYKINYIVPALGNGGGDGGDSLGGILDVLYTNLRLGKRLGVPAHALYRSVIDVFASEAGIDPNRSTNVMVHLDEVRVGRWIEVVPLDRQPAGWNRNGSASAFVFQGGYMTLNATSAAYWYKTNPNPSSEYTLEAVLLSVNAGSGDWDNCIVVETTFGRAWIEAFPNQVRLRGATMATLGADMTQPHVVTLHHVGNGVFRGYLDGTLVGEVGPDSVTLNRLLFGEGGGTGLSNSTWQLVRHKVGGPPIGDSGTVVSVARDFGFVPSRLYLAALDDPGSGAIRYYASRDDGQTWVPTERDGVVDFNGYPVGTKVRVRADLMGEAAIRAWGWTVV